VIEFAYDIGDFGDQVTAVREPLQVYLSTTERERLDRLAARLGVSRSEVLRRGLEALAQAEQPGDRALADLVRRGWLTPPLVTGGPVPQGQPVAPLAELLAELDEERADR
jgi:hypothetical protein